MDVNKMVEDVSGHARLPYKSCCDTPIPLIDHKCENLMI
jgi:hypothetical protein